MFSVLVLLIEFFLIFLLKLLTGMELVNSEVPAIIIIFGLSYFVSLNTSRNLYNYRYVLLVNFLIRVFLLIWDLYGQDIYGLPGSGIDTENFYRHAVRYAHGANYYWQHNAVVFFGTLVRLFGEARLLIQFLLMLFSIATSHIVLSTMQLINIPEKYIKKAMWFMVLLPNYAILSSVFLRESVISFTVAASVYFFIIWWKGKGEVYFIATILMILLGTIFHSGMIGAAIGFILIRVYYNPEKQAFKLTASSILIVATFLLVFTYLYVNYSSLFFTKMARVEELDDIASGYGRGGSSYAAIAGDSSNLFNFIVFTPIRMFLFLFTPLPFQIRGMADVIAMVFNAFFYMWVYFRTIKYISASKNNKLLMISLLLIALSTVFIFGWGGTNIGTNIRHRDKLIPLYTIMLALSFEINILSKGKITRYY